MNEECINALKDIVIIFLNFSDEWLKKKIIDKETYEQITKHKRKFINDLK